MQIEQKELYTPAPLGRRFLAFFLDGLIAGLVLFTLVGIFLAFMISAMLYLEWPLFQALLQGMTETAFNFYILAIFLSFVWFVFYGLLRDSFKNGQSWGKRLLGLRVVELESGRPCSRGASATRNFLGLSLAFIAAFLPVIGWLLFFVEPYAVISSREGQRYGDRWARTMVVVAGR